MKFDIRPEIVNQKRITLITVLLIAMVFFNGTVPSPVKKNAFQAGENLKYLVHYGWIDGGVASLKVENSSLYDRNVYHIIMNARTKGITDKLYRVDDTYESFILPETGLPLKSIRNIKEGNYRNYNEVLFNQDEDYVVSLLTGKHYVPDSTLDILSAFFFLRNILTEKGSTGLKDNEIIKMSTYFGDEIYPLVIRYKGKETIKTDLGKVRCIKFQPVTEVGRVFDENDDMTIWISDDLNFVPIRVQFELFIGSLNCDLIEYTGLKYYMSVK